MGLLGFRRRKTGSAPPADTGAAADAAMPGALTPEAFCALLAQLIDTPHAEQPNGGFGLLMIQLRRSDRARALTGMPSAAEGMAHVHARIAQALRPQDRYAVLSHEEIAVVLPGVTGSGIAMLALNRILRIFDAPIRLASETIRMRPCIGCVFFPEHGQGIEQLFNAADGACREARSLESAYVIYQQSEFGEDSEALVGELHDALHSNSLEVWFQPQLDIRRGQCKAAEALVRWPRAKGAQAVPASLVADLSENNGLMPQLTMFVLNTALRELGNLRKLGIEMHVAVNLSASMLIDPELPQVIAQALATWNVAPQHLTLEVTESSIVRDVERALAIMHELKAIGTRLSVDDFGTGYSSLAYLRRMPLDELKIDKLFVHNMKNSRSDIQIVRSIIDLAHNFELEAVAEGVEDRETLDMLADLGCDIIQGYLFSKPLHPADLTAWWPSQRDLAPMYSSANRVREAS